MTDSEVVLTVAITLLLLTVAALTWWGRRPPYVPRQQEERFAALDPVAEFTGTAVGRAVVPSREVEAAAKEIFDLIGPPPGWVPLSRLRDTGGYVGQIHRDCLTARRDGGEICPECLLRFQPRVGAS